MRAHQLIRRIVLRSMDLRDQMPFDQSSGSSLIRLINYLALTYLSNYHSVCVVKTSAEFILIDVDIPIMVMTVDAQFNTTFRRGVEGGCQAFIVQQHAALWSFLDVFPDAHDYSDQRSAAKKLIVLLDDLSPETSERLCAHLTIRDLPDMLIVLSKEEDDLFEFFTTEITGDGTRGTVTVRIQPVSPPNYFPEKHQNMNGMPIRFQTVMYPPFVYYAETTPEKANARKDPRYYTDNNPVFIDGTEPLLLVEFCQRKNCTIDAYFDETYLWGDVTENRTANGVLGAVATRQADFAVSAIYYWPHPYRFATYTGDISRSGLTVLVPKPSAVAPWRTPFLSFSKHLWIAVGVAFCAGVTAVWLLDKGRSHIKDSAAGKRMSLSDALLSMIGFYMEQTVFMRRDLVACVFLSTSLLFAGFMVGNLYGAGLAGVMTIPQFEAAIETGRDLAKKGLTFVGNDWAWMFALRPSPLAYVQKIVRQYKVVDDAFMVQHRNMRDIGYVAEKTEFGHVGPVDFLDVQSSDNYQLLKEDLAWQYCTAVVTKTCPFKHSFNDLLINIRQSGIQYYWETMVVNRYLSMAIQQKILESDLQETSQDAVILTVSHFIGAFLVLGFGFACAVTVFILENLYAAMHNRNKSWFDISRPLFVCKKFVIDGELK
nr:glutamate receptor-like [Aedes albopictus]